jgi:hypothetical protein
VLVDAPKEEFRKLCDDSHPTTKYSRPFYRWKMRTLVIKVMPGAEHEVSTEKFKGCILYRPKKMK